jgi:hypothetical protein
VRLFLGGSLDGQRRNATGRTVRVPVALGYETEEYVEARLVGHRHPFTVYALQGWTGDDILDRLINGKATDPAKAQQIGNVQRVRVGAMPESEIRKLEDRMVGDTAREAHSAGLRFTDWPTVTRRELMFGGGLPHEREARPGEKPDLLELRVLAVAVPR